MENEATTSHDEQSITDDEQYPQQMKACFIGRTHHLQRLKELFLSSKESSRLHLITMVSDPGVGKTRLAQEFTRAVRMTVPDTRVLWGMSGGPSDISYAAIIQILHERFGITRGDLAADARSKVERVIAEVMPPRMRTELCHLLAHLMRYPYPSSSIVEPLAQVPGHLEVRTYIAVRRFFEKDSQQTTLLLHFDSVERAGAETVNLIHFLAEGLRHCPIIILATARPTLFRRHLKWGQGEFPHELINLGPLDPLEAQALFSELLHTIQLPEELLQVARERLDGSPRAIEELTRFLRETGVVLPQGDHWTIADDQLASSTIPRTHEEILRARLRSLPANERGLLEKAAAVGETFWLDATLALLRAGSMEQSDPDGPTLEVIASAKQKTRAHLAQILSSLVTKGLIIESSVSTIAGEQEYTFAYPPIWDLAYELVDAEDCRRYHRLVAQWLELRPDGRQEEHQEQAGRHLQRAGDGPAAAARYRRAADLARTRYFNDRAIRLYSSALSCVGQADIPTRIHLWHDLGNVYQLKGEFDHALDAYERMVRLSWAIASRTKGAVAFNKLGRLWRQKGNLHLALEYLERSLELFKQVNDRRGIATCLDDIGQSLWLLGRYEDALDRSAKSLEMRRQIGDKRSIAVSLSNIGNIEKDRGLFDEAESCYREAMKLRRSVGDRYGYIVSLNNLGALSFERGELPQARDSWEDALVEAEQIGALPLQMILLNNIGETAYQMGKLTDARQRIERAMTLATEMEDQRATVEILRNLALIELKEGNNQQAKQLGERCLELARKSQMMEMVGKAHLVLGEISAVTLFDESGQSDSRKQVEIFFRNAIRVFRDLGNEAELAKALKRLGEFQIEQNQLEQGRQVLREAADIFDRLKMRSGEEVRRVIKDLEG